MQNPNRATLELYNQILSGKVEALGSIAIGGARSARPTVRIQVATRPAFWIAAAIVAVGGSCCRAERATSTTFANRDQQRIEAIAVLPFSNGQVMQTSII